MYRRFREQFLEFFLRARAQVVGKRHHCGRVVDTRICADTNHAGARVVDGYIKQVGEQQSEFVTLHKHCWRWSRRELAHDCDTLCAVGGNEQCVYRIEHLNNLRGSILRAVLVVQGICCLGEIRNLVHHSGHVKRNS